VKDGQVGMVDEEQGNMPDEAPVVGEHYHVCGVLDGEGR